MTLPRVSLPLNGYLELASAQLLDDNWRELEFNVETGQNVLQDFVMPETGGGYVYRDAKVFGTATQNRFIYWRAANDVLELVEMSTEVLLEGNQVRIRFPNSSIIDSINVIEFSDSVAIMIATLNSVHRLYLPHPKTTNKSILYDLTRDLLYTSTNYYILGNNSSLNNQQPICAASWYDRSLLKCALSFPDSSLLIVQFSKDTHHITTSDIKQVGIIGRIWSRMPALLTRSPNDCVNAVFVCVPYHHHETQDVLLFTLCRDWKIRIFSTNSRECIYTHNMIPQSSFSQSISSYAASTTEQPMMKIYESRVLIYLTENQPEFILMYHCYKDGFHSLREVTTLQTPIWEKLIDYSMTETKIWALANSGETETVLHYLDLKVLSDASDLEDPEIEAVWDDVTLVDDLEVPSIKNYVAEIFWKNRFSVATVQKALVGIAGPSIQKKNDMGHLEWLAYTRIVDEDQEEAWKRFYNYCLQNHHASNKNIGLIVSDDESMISIVKRSNPSLVVPWLVNVDMILRGGPCRGVEFSSNMRSIVEALNYISTELIDDDISRLFEKKLYESPPQALQTIEEIAHCLWNSKKVTLSNLNFVQKTQIATGVDYICEQLDLTNQAKDYGTKVLLNSVASMRSEHDQLESNSGIIMTFELFKRLVRARMTLARDLLIYIYLMKMYTESDKSNPTDKHLHNLCTEFFFSAKVRRILDSLRSYAVLVWLTETPIKTIPTQQPNSANEEVVDFISNRFKFFKNACNFSDKLSESSLDLVLHQNLFMNFMANGGVNFSSTKEDKSAYPQTLSNSFYITEVALNICRLLWPQSDHLCLPEFLFVYQLDEPLSEYLNLVEDWSSSCEYDRHFIRASNCILQNRATQAVDIYNRLWMNMTRTNLIGRFIGLDTDKVESMIDDKVSVNPTLIYRYYDKLLQLFQIYNNHPCLVTLINNCMSLLDGNSEGEQQHWVNCFRAKLFQYYLKLEEPDEAYHTMVLTTDPSLRINCLRKFIVHHCEKEQWSNLLSYPFIDIKKDFIDILNQKADSSDLSKLNGDDFYKTSYYDLLFASYVSDDEYNRAAQVMFGYAQRLAQEVPGIISIRKQADCLLIALNSLRCANDKEAYIEIGSGNHKERGRSSVLKRSYDGESDNNLTRYTNKDDSIHVSTTRVGCKDIELKYELTRARLKLLEKDQAANAIALAPLKAEEIIAQLVASSMFSSAMDLAVLFKAPMEPILEGLTAKYIFIMRLSTVDIAVHQDLERTLSDIFTNSYSNIDTYNYIANSTCPTVEKLWRLIDYYLVTYDGISHRYNTNAFAQTFAGTTLLMRVVASKLLSVGYDIPASLRRMYLARNTTELLRLLMKYDKLEDAAELAIEMMNRILEPSNCYAYTSPFTTSDPPPLYLPTHIILILMTYLSEDATNKHFMKISKILSDKLEKFRHFVEP